MEKIKLITTLNNILEFSPCSEGLDKFLKYVGRDFPKDKEINLLTILESNGIDHFFWCFKTLKNNKKEAFKILSLICADIAESTISIFESKYQKDNRPKKAIEAIRLFVDEKISLNKLIKSKHAASAAAASAAYAADADADAAYASAAAASAASAAYAAADADADAVAAYVAAAAAADAADYAADAAADAAYVAAAAADYAAYVRKKERQKQTDIIKKYLEE